MKYFFAMCFSRNLCPTYICYISSIVCFVSIKLLFCYCIRDGRNSKFLISHFGKKCSMNSITSQVPTTLLSVWKFHGTLKSFVTSWILLFVINDLKRDSFPNGENEKKLSLSHNSWKWTYLDNKSFLEGAVSYEKW